MSQRQTTFQFIMKSMLNMAIKLYYYYYYVESLKNNGQCHCHAFDHVPWQDKKLRHKQLAILHMSYMHAYLATFWI